MQDSAVLIFGPNGEVFATPQADPSFLDAPTQPPTVVPLPTSTTGADSVILSSPSPTTSSSLQIILTDLIVTETGTSVVYITSCPAWAQNCLPDSSTSATTISTSTTGYYDYIPATTSTITSLYITDGGSRPATPVPTSSLTELSPHLTSQTSTSRTSGGVLIDPIQATYRNIVHYTEYRIQTVEVCAATSTQCSRSTILATAVGERTEVSCSPGLCSGVLVATGLTADVTATGTCIRV